MDLHAVPVEDESLDQSRVPQYLHYNMEHSKKLQPAMNLGLRMLTGATFFSLGLLFESSRSIGAIYLHQSIWSPILSMRKMSMDREESIYNNTEVQPGHSR